MAARDHFGPQLQMFIPAGAFEEAARDPKSRFWFGDAPLDEEAEDELEALKQEKLEGAERRGARPVNAEYYMETGLLRYPGDASFRESIRREGVKEPVQIELEGDQDTLIEGHHRVFTAADIDPTMEIPVSYW